MKLYSARLYEDAEQLANGTTERCKNGLWVLHSWNVNTRGLIVALYETEVENETQTTLQAPQMAKMAQVTPN